MRSIEYVFEDNFPAPTFTAPEEADLIERTLAGDEDAFCTLAESYVLLLRRTDRRHRYNIPDTDERRSILLWAFYEVLKDAEPGVRIAQRKMTFLNLISSAIQDAREGLFVPKRTAEAYFAAIRDNDGEVPEDGTADYSREHLLAVRDAVHGWGSLDVAMTTETDYDSGSAEPDAFAIGDGPGEDVIRWTPAEVQEYAARALEALEDEPALLETIRLRYGFDALPGESEGGDEVPVQQAASVLGVTRSTLLRREKKALGLMRAALLDLAA